MPTADFAPSAVSPNQEASLSFDAFARVRRQTEQLVAPLETEDFVVQPGYEVSPLKWHLAHASWFFEHFILERYCKGYEPFSPLFHQLFNSYYRTEGELLDKGARGAMSRPTVAEVFACRRHVDDGMRAWLSQGPPEPEAAELAVLGLNHEQQHQELMVFDIKRILHHSPAAPPYAPEPGTNGAAAQSAVPMTWTAFGEGVLRAGHEGGGFCYDNEQPAHRVFLEPFALADRLVSNGEYLEFIEAGGYADSRFWLDDGFAHIRKKGWQAPLYWRHSPETGWEEYHLQGGWQPLRLAAPVVHLSFYEADAYARWRGLRLPTEFEWERAARDLPPEGHFLEAACWRPRPAEARPLAQLFGTAWEWTGSAYAPYPGYHCLYEGAGEYNGKFMANQMTLRGGSFGLARDHFRRTYRNFFYPHDRWQIAGLRLAKSL